MLLFIERFSYCKQKICQFNLISKLLKITDTRTIHATNNKASSEIPFTSHNEFSHNSSVFLTCLVKNPISRVRKHVMKTVFKNLPSAFLSISHQRVFIVYTFLLCGFHRWSSCKICCAEHQTETKYHTFFESASAMAKFSYYENEKLVGSQNLLSKQSLISIVRLVTFCRSVSSNGSEPLVTLG